MTTDKPLHKMGEDELEDHIQELRSNMRLRWVQVADAILRGESNRQAYWNAYKARELGKDITPDKADIIDASVARLLRNDRVSQYMTAIRHRESRVEDATLSHIVRQMIDIARNAAADKDYTNQRLALAEVAKLLDHYPSEKRELLVKSEGLADLSPAEWEALFSAEQSHEAPGDTVTH